MMKLKMILTFCIYYVTALYQDIYSMESVNESERKCCCLFCCLCDCFKVSKVNSTNEKIFVSRSTQVYEYDFKDESNNITPCYVERDNEGNTHDKKKLNYGYIEDDGNNGNNDKVNTSGWGCSNIYSQVSCGLGLSNNDCSLLRILNEND